MHFYSEAIELKEALKRLDCRIQRLAPKFVAIEESVGLAAAGRIVAPYPDPRFDCSAMDGFAIHNSDLAGKKLRIVGQVRIGAGEVPTLNPGEAVYVDTGAQLPVNTDAVVPVEQTKAEKDQVYVPESITEKNVKRTGERHKKGDTLLESGTIIGLDDVSLLASQGLSEVQVVPRPSVAFVRTGDEIALEPSCGQVYDANTPTFLAWCYVHRLEVQGVHAVGDCMEDIVALLKELKADLIVTTGGASVGARDLTRQAVASIAEIIIPGVKVKPGSPAFVALRDRQVILGLPGIPRAAVHQLQLLGDAIVALLARLPCPATLK